MLDTELRYLVENQYMSIRTINTKHNQALQVNYTNK